MKNKYCRRITIGDAILSQYGRTLKNIFKYGEKSVRDIPSTHSPIQGGDTRRKNTAYHHRPFYLCSGFRHPR